MKRFLKWLSRSNGAGQTRRPESARLRLESLEDRQVPSISYGGGPIIPHAQVTNVYYGQDWSQPANQSDITNLDQFTKTILGSSYMSMLGEYGVGTGSYQGHDVQTSGPAAYTTVSESTIRSMLSNEILSFRVPQPTSSTVYAVFLPPNVSYPWYNRLGYNSSGWVSSWTFVWNGSHVVPEVVSSMAYYIVIPHPQGNVADNGYNLTSLTSDFQKQTEIFSEELADAVTDPYATSGFYGTGWHDSSSPYGGIGEEAGAYQQVAWLDGYAVQREWSNYFQRGIVPAWDTAGGYAYLGGWNYQYDTYTAAGRHGLVGIQQYGPVQCNWQLDDGSYAGWFIVG
jgi:hypothetical protein